MVRNEDQIKRVGIVMVMCELNHVWPNHIGEAGENGLVVHACMHACFTCLSTTNWFSLNPTCYFLYASGFDVDPIN